MGGFKKNYVSLTFDQNCQFMRKTIVSLVFMLLSLGAWAQYAQSDALKRSGVHLSLNGETLSPEAQAALLSNIGGTDYTAMWEEARSSRALGTGLTIGGLSPDGNLVETVEITSRPFYVGVQYHPEFKSRPNKPHPLFVGFIQAAIEKK